MEMTLRADYHIHSVYSKNRHGKSTIEEIVKKAIELGLEEIAITDHGPKHYMYGIKRSRITEAKNEIVELRKKFPQIKILFGAEANILNYEGDIDIDEELYKIYDIVLCGYHIAVTFKSFNDFFNFLVMNFLSKLSHRLSSRMAEKNTDAVVNALDKNRVDILTHPGDKINVNISRIAEAAERNGTVLEISNSHGHLNSEEIKIAAGYDVKFAINSDAHIKDKVGGFGTGLKAALDAGLDLKRIINLV
jgi:putative hydrolase